MGGQQTERLLRISVETTAIRNAGGDVLKDVVLQFLGVIHHASDDIIDRFWNRLALLQRRKAFQRFRRLLRFLVENSPDGGNTFCRACLQGVRIPPVRLRDGRHFLPEINQRVVTTIHILFQDGIQSGHEIHKGRFLLRQLCLQRKIVFQQCETIPEGVFLHLIVEDINPIGDLFIEKCFILAIRLQRHEESLGKFGQLLPRRHIALFRRCFLQRGGCLRHCLRHVIRCFPKLFQQVRGLLLKRLPFIVSGAGKFLHVDCHVFQPASERHSGNRHQPTGRNEHQCIRPHVIPLLRVFCHGECRPGLVQLARDFPSGLLHSLRKCLPKRNKRQRFLHDSIQNRRFRPPCVFNGLRAGLQKFGNIVRRCLQ